LNPYLLAAVPLALLVGYLRGRAAGRDEERERVNHGMIIAMSFLLSKALYLLNGWNRGDITEDELSVGLKEYAAEKKAKHDAEYEAFVERLNKRSEKGTEYT
jgi:hypothetical protein